MSGLYQVSQMEPELSPSIEENINSIKFLADSLPGQLQKMMGTFPIDTNAERRISDLLLAIAAKSIALYDALNEEEAF